VVDRKSSALLFLEPLSPNLERLYALRLRLTDRGTAPLFENGTRFAFLLERNWWCSAARISLGRRLDSREVRERGSDTGLVHEVAETIQGRFEGIVHEDSSTGAMIIIDRSPLTFSAAIVDLIVPPRIIRVIPGRLR
jgi:hypothetical protein